MLLNRLLKYAIISKPNNLALRISAYVFFLLMVSFGLLIAIYHFQSLLSEKRGFMVELLLMRQTEDFPDNIIKRDFTDFTEQRDKIKVNELHDYLIISDTGKIYMNGIFELIDKQEIINNVKDDISYISFGSNTYIISYITVNDKSVYIAKNVTFRAQGERRIIVISIMLSVLMLVLIYFISNRLSLIAIEPIKNANQRLKNYNHNLAHELKTPISIMKSDLELSKLSGESAYCSKTVDELKHIEDIVNSLLTLSETGGNDANKEVSVGNLIMNVTNKLKKNFKDKNLKIELEILKDYKLNTNDKLLDIMLKNIIENALKYSLENSTIAIQVDSNLLTVKNPGKILSQEEIDSLFQPFFKGSNSEIGYGLGLNIVKTIADQNGWKVRFWAKKEIYTLEVEF